jgi:hypothetical protein
MQCLDWPVRAALPAPAVPGPARLAPAVTEQESGTFVDGEPECGYASEDHSVIANVTIFDPKTTKFDLKHGAVSDAALCRVIRPH